MRSDGEDNGPAAAEALAADFGWALRSVSIAFQSLARDAVLEIPGGPRAYLVLVAVARAEARSQLALARHLAIDKTQMTIVLDALESEGLVERVPDPADRRARLIRITPRGEQRLQHAGSSLRGVEEQLLDPLSAEDRAHFRRLLATVASAAVEGAELLADQARGDRSSARPGTGRSGD